MFTMIVVKAKFILLCIFQWYIKVQDIVLPVLVKVFCCV